MFQLKGIYNNNLVQLSEHFRADLTLNYVIKAFVQMPLNIPHTTNCQAYWIETNVFTQFLLTAGCEDYFLFGYVVLVSLVKKITSDVLWFSQPEG